MTTWVEDPEGGRPRGPRGLVHAWIEVMIRPRRFFRTGIAPGDQAPGLVFAAAVAVIYAAQRLVFAPETVPVSLGGPLLSGLIALLATALVVAPALLHLTAAIQTVFILVFMNSRLDRDHGGVSETVQLIAYATAPCVLAGFPVAPLRVAATGYGAVLLLLGTAVVHEAYTEEAILTGIVPAAIVFGGAFGGYSATIVLWQTVVAIVSKAP